MIETLAKPSICVIDEDESDFRPILDALNALYLSSIHIKGDTTEGLPVEPFQELRLVFTDLYLASGATGKDMASHTANIFRKVVSPNTAPVVVVIWSKHAGEKIDDGTPPDDQPTEADLFISTLLEAEPNYKGRLIFVRMTKARTENWVEELKCHIANLLDGHESIEALWIWESLVKSSALKVSKDLTDFSNLDNDPRKTLKKLKEVLQLLTNKQKEGLNLTAEAAPYYLSVVLGQLLVDQLEHADGIQDFMPHSDWLIQPVANIEALSPSINSMLLTADLPNSIVPFLPGSIYCVNEEEELCKLISIDLGEIKSSLCEKKEGSNLNAWMSAGKLALIELTPSCDVDNGERAIATLLIGFVMPKLHYKFSQSKESFQRSPIFSLRKGLDAFEKQDVFLVYSSRYKVTLPANNVPEWLEPWFRLRELHAASIRNWHSSQASRVGYVYL